MKSILFTFATSLILSTTAFAQEINFEGPENTTDTVEIVIVQQTIEGTITYAPGRVAPEGSWRLFDEAGKQRFSMAVSSTQNAAIFIYGRNDQIVNSYAVEPQTLNQLVIATSTASNECPVTIEVSRTQRKIERVKSTCDDL